MRSTGRVFKAHFYNKAESHVVSEAKDNFREDDDARWQWSEATWTGSPEGEPNQAHQYGVPTRGNAIRFRRIAWPRTHSGFIHHLAPQILVVGKRTRVTSCDRCGSLAASTLRTTTRFT